jgi:hypothetical protein
MGYEDGRLDSEDITVDSSGFELRSGSLWRLVKWNRSLISKTSSIFNNVHLAVALPCRSIVGIHVSEAKKFDSIAFGSLILSAHKRLLISIKRLHGDKAYWDSKIIGWCYQEGMTPVIPCKNNSLKNGSNKQLNRLTKYQREHKGNYKKNTRSYRRVEVEHLFDEVKLQYPILRDIKLKTKIKRCCVISCGIITRQDFGG